MNMDYSCWTLMCADMARADMRGKKKERQERQKGRFIKNSGWTILSRNCGRIRAKLRPPFDKLRVNRRACRTLSVMAIYGAIYKFRQNGRTGMRQLRKWRLRRCAR